MRGHSKGQVPTSKLAMLAYPRQQCCTTLYFEPRDQRALPPREPTNIEWYAIPTLRAKRIKESTTDML
eukprot:1215929-Amphidinium_carterae.1